MFPQGQLNKFKLTQGFQITSEASSNVNGEQPRPTAGASPQNIAALASVTLNFFSGEVLSADMEIPCIIEDSEGERR